MIFPGFGKLLENPELAVKGSKNLKLPELSPQRFITYLKSVRLLVPSNEVSENTEILKYTYIYADNNNVIIT